ncbi:MAG: corrinoid protein [Anaerolineales bacterium]|jgi:5-methyltetrahydrofolate--homocysteine methyltransferase
MSASITEAIRDGNSYDIVEMVQARLDSGADPHDLLKAMTDGLDECGNLFESGEYFLPELIMAGDALTEAIGVLEPRLGNSSMGQAGKVLLGTVAGDVHDIAKNLVGFLLKSTGFEVVDLGTANSTEVFVVAVREHSPDVLGMSALLTTTMLGMEDVNEALEKEGLRSKTRVIISGGPVSDRFAEQIKADAYAFDAVAGVKEIKKLVSK